jgi:uncharacterized protein YhfF
MKPTEAVAGFWAKFCLGNSEIDPASSYQIWHFGNTAEMADELLERVLVGKKTATASLPWEYDERPSETPTVGVHSVVTDFHGHPKCIVRTIEVRVLPFCDVGPQFASDEGEGDQSLEYWRDVHWKYFSEQCRQHGKKPSETMHVLCERFALLYPEPIKYYQG